MIMRMAMASVVCDDREDDVNRECDDDGVIRVMTMTIA